MNSAVKIILLLLVFAVSAVYLIQWRAEKFQRCPISKPGVPFTVPPKGQRNIPYEMIQLASALYTPTLVLPQPWSTVLPSPFYSQLDKGYAILIARNTVTNEYVVSIRGSVMVTTKAGIIDWFNDLNVLQMVTSPSPLPGMMSQGAFNGIAAISRAIPNFGQIIPHTTAPTIYVTGHSLGGSLVPIVSLWILSQIRNANIIPVSFAAPSTTDADFEAVFSEKLGAKSMRIWNTQDFVPYAWSDLDHLPAYINDFKQDPVIKSVFSIFESVTRGEFCYTTVPQSLTLDGLPILNKANLPTLIEKIGLMHSYKTYMQLLS